MDCLEAQRLIRPYLQKNLSDKELARFVDHIEHCQNCREELEINMAVKAVLEDGQDSHDRFRDDFAKTLKKEIAADKRHLAVVRTETFVRRLAVVLAEFILVVTIITSVELRKWGDHTLTSLYRFIHRGDAQVTRMTETETESDSNALGSVFDMDTDRNSDTDFHSENTAEQK